MSKTGFTHEDALNETKEWYTPPEIFVGLGLTFDLDPCSPPGGPMHVPFRASRKYYTYEDNGLVQPWRGRVWMNPPYGPDLPAWMGRLAAHGDGIALVFARTDTEWFHEYVVDAGAVAFIRGRVRFIKPDGTPGGSPGAGSMLVAYGADCVAAVNRYPNAVTAKFLNAHKMQPRMEM
jgi:hypothetical protein